MKKRAVIITGGFIDLQFARDYLAEKHYDIVIAADKGVASAYELGITVDYVLGDFDSLDSRVLQTVKESITNTQSKTVLKEFPPEKDYTDTHLAILTAIELGATSVAILGATGTRLDHVLANINLLLVLEEHEVKAKIIDAYNKIYVITNTTELEKQKLYGEYISLIPYTDAVIGVTLEGFKYPLRKATLTKGNSLGISNEIVENKAVIKLDQGVLIVIESRD